MLTAEELDRALYLLLHQDDTNVLLGWEILRGHPEVLADLRLHLVALLAVDCPDELELDLARHLSEVMTEEAWNDWKRVLFLIREPYFDNATQLENHITLHETKRSLLEPIFKRSARLALHYFPVASDMYEWDVAPSLIPTYLSTIHQAVPTHIPTLLLLGEWCIKYQHSYLAAEQWFAKALAIAPNHAQAHYQMGVLQLQYLIGDSADYQKSLDFLRQAHTLDPTEAIYGYGWARALHRAGQETILHQALEALRLQFPHDEAGLLWAGCYFLYEKNDLERARIYYDQFTALYTLPYHADVLVFWGVCELMLNDNTDEAAYYFDYIRYTEITPSLLSCIIAFTHLVLYCDAPHNAQMIYDEYELAQLSDETLALTILPQQQAAFRQAETQFLTSSHQL